jgi:hypothetical protein
MTDTSRTSTRTQQQPELHDRTGRVFVGSVYDELFAKELTPYARLVLFTLRTFADDKGVCWPAVLTISESLGISERRVQYAIRELEATHRLQNLGLSNVGTNKYQLIGFDLGAQS